MNHLIRLSENKYVEKDTGFLVCKNSIFSKVGVMKYRLSEILKGKERQELKKDKIVDVLRTQEELFSQESIDSLKDKALVLEHPKNGFVNIENHKELAKGHVTNVYADYDNLYLRGDVIITDSIVKDLILTGKTNELSLGYQYEYEKQEDTENYIVKNLMYNHLALTEKGRAEVAMILDDNKKIEEFEEEEKMNEKIEELSKQVQTLSDSLKAFIEKEEQKIILDSKLKEEQEELAKKLEEEKLKEKKAEEDKKIIKDSAYFVDKMKEAESLQDENIKTLLLDSIKKEMKEELGIDETSFVKPIVKNSVKVNFKQFKQLNLNDYNSVAEYNKALKNL